MITNPNPQPETRELLPPERVYLPLEVAHAMSADAPPDSEDVLYARVHVPASSVSEAAVNAAEEVLLSVNVGLECDGVTIGVGAIPKIIKIILKHFPPTDAVPMISREASKQLVDEAYLRGKSVEKQAWEAGLRATDPAEQMRRDCIEKRGVWERAQARSMGEEMFLALGKVQILTEIINELEQVGKESQ